MRILLWTEQYWPHIGGIEVRAHRLGVGLLQRGNQVAVVTSHGSLALPDSARRDGLEIRRFRFWEALAGKRLDLFADARRKVAAFKREFRPDATHVFFTDPSVVFHWQTRDAAPGPTVIGVPIGLSGLRAGDGTLLRDTLMRADWVVAVSEAMRADVLRMAPELAARCSVIYNSLDPPLLWPAPLEFERPAVLCLGRVSREKGFDVALDAFCAVSAQIPAARLLIAGDGPARGELEQKSARLGLRDKVEFLGWVSPDAVPAVINRATVVIVPSRWREAFGNVALQAMQMGRPVVTTDMGALPEVVQHGVSGLVTSSENAAELADATVRLLRDPALARRLGEAGRSIASTRFPFEQYLSEHESLYARIGEHRA